jgi:carboxylate-amine ligase
MDAPLRPPAETPAIRIPFHGSPRPTLGVELELQVLDPVSFNLRSASCEVIARVGADHPKIKQELTQSTVEIITGICETVGEARADLAATLAELYAAGDALGVTFASAGTHPFAQWRDQKIFPNPRYRSLVDRIQWPARRLLIYGLHVHVGLASGEKAIAVQNGLTTYIPHLLALSASSPYVDFEDTGLASARSKIFEGMPTAGLPVRLASYGEFQEFMNTLVRAGAIESVREIWWDIRPHPGFGTVEVRVCDAPSTLREVCALAALVQCLAVYLGEQYDDGVPMRLLHPWVVRENKWRAGRHGLDADVIMANDGAHAPLRALVPVLLDELAPYAARLGCADELADVARALDGAASYERQRATLAEANRLPDVPCRLAAELRAESDAAVTAARASAPAGDGAATADAPAPAA